MQISSRTQIIIGATVAVVTLLSKGTVALPMGVPPEVGQYITSWSNFLIAIYVVIAPLMPAFSDSSPGPLAPPDAPAVVKAQAVADLKPDDPISKVTAVKEAAKAVIDARNPKAGPA